MKLSTVVSAIVLAATTQIPLQALASTAPICDKQHGRSIAAINYSSSWSDPLNTGDYALAGAHIAGSSFFEELTFSLTTTSDINVGIIDITMPAATFKNSRATQLPDLLGDKYLTLSLFDNAGQLLGSTGAGGTLTALGLTPGNDYVLTIAGKASGVLGGIYAGNLSVEAVPISSTAPLLGSALVILMMRSRKFRTVANH